jgi:hypothetical protein
MSGLELLNQLIGEHRNRREQRQEKDRVRRAARSTKVAKFEKQREQKRIRDARYRAKPRFIVSLPDADNRAIAMEIRDIAGCVEESLRRIFPPNSVWADPCVVHRLRELAAEIRGP